MNVRFWKHDDVAVPQKAAPGHLDDRK